MPSDNGQKPKEPAGPPIHGWDKNQPRPVHGPATKQTVPQPDKKAPDKKK